MPAWMLIVNGEVGDGLTLLRQVERLGHRSTVTARTESAGRLLQDDHYDLVLIDAGLFEAGGRALLAAPTPVIVMNGPRDSHVVCDWLRAGAADHLPSGACAPQLKARIDAALALRRALDLECDVQAQVDRVLAAACRDDAPPVPTDLLARAGPWAGLARGFLALAAENRALRVRAAPTAAPADP